MTERVQSSYSSARFGRGVQLASEYLEEILEQAPLAIHILSGDGVSLLSNTRWNELWDLPLEIASEGRSIFEDDRVRAAGLLPYITSALEGQSLVSEPLRYEPARVGSDGQAKWLRAMTFPAFDSKGEIRRVTLMLEDVTEKRRLEERLKLRAYHDQLTGLPNRTLLMDRLQNALKRLERDGNRGGIALVFINLDNFKYVNDSMGHAAGDELMCKVGERLVGQMRSGDTVARIGGDEFVLLLEGMEEQEKAVSLVERMLLSLRSPFMIRGKEIFLTASVGFVLEHPDSKLCQDADTMMRSADVAMYRAKQTGKDGFRVFDGTMSGEPTLRLALESGLRRAIENDELELYCQPQVDLRSGGVTGVEMLLRWHDPQRGLVLPGEFISVAEETDLIVEIGDWVLVQACDLAAEIQRFAGESTPTVWINVSARQLYDPSFAERVREIIEISGITPQTLGVEVTETVAMDHFGLSIEHTAEVLGELKGMGIGIAIDDFGTGYSSLAYLRRLPADVLKIDRMFVSRIEHSREDEAICAAIVSLGSVMNLEVIAEGVEDAAQLDAVRRLGCDAMQGYFLERPLPREEFLKRFSSKRHYALENPG